MNYVKPQKPLIQDGKGIYPITTIDQVVRADGRRFSENEFNRVFQRNLLRSTLQTTTKDGVTCTDNGDGTYTLNGTNTSDNETLFEVVNYKFKNGTYKILGGQSSENCWFGGSVGAIPLSGGIFTLSNSWLTLYAVCKPRGTFDNLVFKPMITEDLNATYDDFVSFDDSVITGINSGLKMDLLWTNASPTSEFAPQVISLDLSEYKLVAISFKAYHNAANSRGDLRIIEKGVSNISIPQGSNSGAVDTRTFQRIINSINDSGIDFGNGIGSSATTESGVIIPIQIYGIK